MSDLIPLVLLVIAVGFLAFQLVISQSKRAVLAQKLVQSQVDKELISSRLADLTSLQPEIENDFVKFLSDSREDAFNFIANVQDTILELKNATEAKDHNKSTDAYNKLISFLPDDNDMVK